MHILVVDDEPLARARLQTLLQQGPDAHQVRTAGDGEAALAACLQAPPDLVLADIEMPGLPGTALSRRLAELPRPPQVVFCTAHAQFAAEAFALGAADYLLKPVSAGRLAEALERARRLRRPAPKPTTAAAIPVRVGNTLQRIPLADVLYLLAEQKYVTIHHAGGECLSDTSLRQFEQRYPGQWMRLHRNCLVPRVRLLGLRLDGDGRMHAHLAGTDFTPRVSRRNLPAVRQLLQRD